MIVSKNGKLPTVKNISYDDIFGLLVSATSEIRAKTLGRQENGMLREKRLHGIRQPYSVLIKIIGGLIRTINAKLNRY